MNEGKPWRVVTALLIAIVGAAAWLVLLLQTPRTVRATDLTVCPAGLPDCQYSSIQAAVDAASAGDVIKVAAGDYADVNNHGGLAQVVYVSKTVTIRGGYTTAFTEPPDPENNHSVLDAQELGRALYIIGDISPVIEGLRFTGGDATGLGGGYNGSDSGGGVYVHTAAATISNCVVYSNTASTSSYGYGGGLYLRGADGITLTGNTIADNVASTASTYSAGVGGGISLYQSNATLRGNTVTSNTGSTSQQGNGGGLALIESAATISDNTVEGNTASLGWHGNGGGVYISNQSIATLSGNTIVANVANDSTNGRGYGGGLYLNGFHYGTLSENVIQGNTASLHYFGNGGGIYLDGGENVVLSGNTVQGNAASRATDGVGGGLYVDFPRGVLTVSGNTIISNTATLSPTAAGYGGGFRVDGDDHIDLVILTNNVVAGNSANTQGSGLWFDGYAYKAWDLNVHLLHNTIADNHSSGQGVYAKEYTTLVFTNTIIAGHDSAGVFLNAGTCDAHLEATLWHDNGLDTAGAGTIATGTVNVHADPAFVDPAGRDYHLSALSPAVNQGVDAGVTTDIDGDPRPWDLGYDIGADEVFVCEAVSNASLQRSPGGDLSAGNTVRFSAGADGSTPLAYAWTLNGVSVGDSRDTFEHTFDLTGTYTAGVTVTNFCSQDSASLVFQVQEAAAGQPDLSISDKSASLPTVQDGDTVAYTVILRNASQVAATVTLTDPIPLHTDYVPGSAQASDGNPVTLDGGELEWSGQVVSGTPVLVSFAVQVDATGLVLGSQIANTAYVDDGLDHLLLLSTESLFNPGYGLIINDGAGFTNSPLVTLRYSWNVADDIIQVQFSNDRGFRPGLNTSAWLAVQPHDPAYHNWTLDTGWLQFLPCTVYARFRDSGGLVHGPVRDWIIYDNTAPGRPTIGILPPGFRQNARGEGVTAGTDVILRITGSDANSGVDRVQVSHRADLATFAEFPFVGPTTDIPWTLQPSGQVHIRVVDRAGNLSEISSGQGPTDYYEIYVPCVQRPSP
jgi:uncharacterized repeat protein (TIGR01451 family)